MIDSFVSNAEICYRTSSPFPARRFDSSPEKRSGARRVKVTAMGAFMGLLTLSATSVTGPVRAMTRNAASEWKPDPQAPGFEYRDVGQAVREHRPIYPKPVPSLPGDVK